MRDAKKPVPITQKKARARRALKGQTHKKPTAKIKNCVNAQKIFETHEKKVLLVATSLKFDILLKADLFHYIQNVSTCRHFTRSKFNLGEN